jgi:hypothetical protein
VHHEGAGVATTFWAGLGAVRRDALLAADGFDEERFPHASIEDIELGIRLHRAGARIMLDPAIQGKHLKVWTLTGMTSTDLFRRGVPWLRLMLEDGSHSTALNLGWRQRVATGASVTLVAGLAKRNARLTAASAAVLLALDERFYRLLFRQRGIALVAIGVPLHVAHRITSAAAVPLALAAHLFDRRPTRSRNRPQ